MVSDFGERRACPWPWRPSSKGVSRKCRRGRPAARTMPMHDAVEAAQLLTDDVGETRQVSSLGHVDSMTLVSWGASWRCARSGSAAGARIRIMSPRLAPGPAWRCGRRWRTPSAPVVGRAPRIPLMVIGDPTPSPPPSTGMTVAVVLGVVRGEEPHRRGDLLGLRACPAERHLGGNDARTLLVGERLGSVRVDKPGATTLKVMLARPSWRVNARSRQGRPWRRRRSTAPQSRAAPRPTMDDHLLARHPTVRASTTRKAPVRFRCRGRGEDPPRTSASELVLGDAALATGTSTRTCSASISYSSCTCSVWVMSHLTAHVQCGEGGRQLLPTSDDDLSPASAKARAMARPMPRSPPVTRTERLNGSPFR